MDKVLVCEYLCLLMPVFCRLYDTSLVAAVRRASLSLMRKAVHYVDKDTLRLV